MKLKLVRKWKKEGYTIGQLYVDGIFFSNTIEDNIIFKEEVEIKIAFSIDDDFDL